MINRRVASKLAEDEIRSCNGQFLYISQHEFLKQNHHSLLFASYLIHQPNFRGCWGKNSDQLRILSVLLRFCEIQVALWYWKFAWFSKDIWISAAYTLIRFVQHVHQQGSGYIRYCHSFFVRKTVWKKSSFNVLQNC